MTELLLKDLERLLVGRSPAMHRLRVDIVRYGALKLPVLIEGPTGSGKELVARGLHIASRRSGALVAFNICALPDTMFEDALFGHVKGAFTGASSDALGYLAEANGGTVVLDEINGLSQVAQAKLLRAIETGEYRPVGARRDRISDFRLVSTSNANLVDAVSVGQFRSDLYFRLSGLTLSVPSLRHRLGDMPDLVQHFFGDFGEGGCVLTADAMEALAAHTWPGNVRELRHVLARAISMTDTRFIDGKVMERAIGMAERVVASRVDDARTELETLLSRHGWDTERVAQDLGVHRATVYRRMQRYGLNGDVGTEFR